MPSSPVIKPHLEYQELVARLKERGMIIPDEARAMRKLSQIGYYRLSGFWYPCRRPKFDNDGKFLKDAETGLPVRDDRFQDNINFNNIIDLYLFDKKLRQLMLDGIERIEIYMRSIIAHEIGKIDPLAYEKEEFINPKVTATKRKNGRAVNHWFEWMNRLCNLINSSKEDCIIWHRKRGLPIPFWAVIECWDYGLMSKYFDNLNGRCQQKIIRRVGFAKPSTLISWLTEINILRNKCAHHARIWNRASANPISLKGFETDPYFQSLNLDLEARRRIYGQAAVIWYFVRKIGPSSDWIKRFADLVDSKPALEPCPYTAMGFPDNSGFPRELFGID
ncbi:MAG: Abi family protein [Candidatus Electrothrix sp. AU1_5]|nr:Abi family protein [Candidatus Electrothrix gigas]